MSELADKAIAGDQDSQSKFRKLTACGIALVAGGPAAAAAVSADKSIFRKTVEYAVGKGEMMADEAVDKLIDRGAAHLSIVLHHAISKAVDVGCRVAGGLVGHLFGPAGVVTGQQIGAKIAGFLNTNLSPLIDKGISKVKDVARTVYQKGKAFLKKTANKIKSFIFG